MDFRERMSAVLHGGRPDRVPFAPYDNLLPCGDFARELGNRGMGLCLRRSTAWSECPHVVTAMSTEGDIHTTTYTTPVGSVSTSRRTHLGRIDDSGSLELDGLIKGSADYEPVVYMLDDTTFHADSALYHNALRDVGADGIIFSDGLQPPYDATRSYYGSVYGLDRWVYAQADEPERFASLLAALERRARRCLPLLLEAPGEVRSMGSVDGQYGPTQFRRYVLPFFQEIVPRYHARGKLVSIHAHASNLSVFTELIARTGADIIEAFTPPPIGDLSVAEARHAWGPDVVIGVNFPETIFWYGPRETREYTLDILRSDPCPRRLYIGMTEMGTYGVTDDESEHAFKEGLRAVMQAIEEFGEP